ncbi:ApeA N-terminal domain 1-containing protein [Halococcus thailandensis]|uniref:Uncharacterized protein n=1 Tax=Halococcus thailandensis JCM 13552 TaxID=1227457 RepID=M0NJF7_9EURY|nr:HEPN domain-containing protein [Halococcus thailandensis]EMA56815.1 hypothetical protein C451_00375 [Halococcus thailandensis JCM 13552]
MDAQTFKGKWWSPNSPDEKVPGIVEYHPEEGEVDLFGTLVESEEDDEEAHFMEMDLEDHVEGFLLGETIESKLVTITDAVPVNISRPSIGNEAGHPNSVYKFTRVYTGGHFEEEPEFNQVSFGFNGLAEWFGESRIEHEVSDEDGIRSRYGVKEPKTVEIKLRDAELTFFVGTTVSSSVTATELEDSVRVNIIPDEPLPFPELSNRYINPLQRYLALATATPVQPTDVSGMVGEDTWIKVFSNIPSHAPADRSVSRASMLFRPDDVNLENSLQHWFQDEGQAEYLFNFYFGTIYNSHLFLEHQFLSLAVAIESYFSHRYPDFKIMEKDAYRDLRKSLVSEIPNGLEVKERIQNLLQSIGNLPSFKDKLEMVVEEERSVLTLLVDVDETLSTATTIRHDLAHGLGEDYSTEELVKTRYKLQIIIECILLDIAGVEDKHKAQVLYSNYQGADFLSVDKEVKSDE